MPVTFGINLLVVGDGFKTFGVNFASVQDQTNCTFTISEFLYLLRNSTEVAATVDTASRNADPSAHYQNFVFSDASLAKYNVLWLAGYEGLDDNNETVAALPPIGTSEIAAIWAFMDRGNGVFATGDHAGLGSYMCGNIPRVRSMRKWFSKSSELPPDCQQGIDASGTIVSMVNWAGGASSSNEPGVTRLDSLRRNPTDVGSVYDFDDQSDDIPQVLALRTPVHPILQGAAGPITRFPDHMHEGEVVTPHNPGTVVIGGLKQIEYPQNVVGTRPLPQIIATGMPEAGHSVAVTSDLGKHCAFFGDTSPAQGGTHGTICAYDGWPASAGRIVTDASFHHFLDLNLIGNPLATTADRRQGLGPKYERPAAGSALAGLQEYYLNTVEWLARPRRGIAVGPQATVANQTDVFVIDDAGNLTVSWVIGAGKWSGPAEPFFPFNKYLPYSAVGGARSFVDTDQTDVYGATADGVIDVFSVHGAGTWWLSGVIGQAGRFPPGAYIAASNQFGVPGQTDVFAIDSQGVLTVSWTGQSNDWSGPQGLSLSEFPRGGALAASMRHGAPNQTDVYAIDNFGTVRVASVTAAGRWSAPTALVQQGGQFLPGSPVAVSNQFGVPTQTDVFAIDLSGTLNVFWAGPTGAWNGPHAIGPAGMFPPGAHVAASNRFGVPDQTDVFAIDLTGALTVASVRGTGVWSNPTPITSPRQFAPGAPIAVSNQLGIPDQTDVFAVSRAGQLTVSWVLGLGRWTGPAPI